MKSAQPGLPRAMVLTVSSVLSLVTGLSCHHHPRDAERVFADLNASVGASGPHGFAVRFNALRLAHCRVHRILHPTSVTTRTPLSSGRDDAGHRTDFSGEKSEKFSWPVLDKELTG